MVIVFGGAFNPPTVAHREIYYHIKKHIDFDMFLYLPVSNLYTKSSLISNIHRLNMLKLMTEDLEKATVSDIELNDTEFLGTYQSLMRIQDLYQKNVAFVLGADNLENIHRWISFHSLISEFKFILINRNNIDIKSMIENDKTLAKYKENFIILPGFDMYVSSTIFRETFEPSYVPNKVFEYIMTHNLY